MSNVTRHSLLIDDAVESRGSLSRLLGAAGYAVTIACALGEGLKLAQTGTLPQNS